MFVTTAHSEHPDSPFYQFIDINRTKNRACIALGYMPTHNIHHEIILVSDAISTALQDSL